MREIAIDSVFHSKIARGKKFFYSRELPNDFPSLTPGEWVRLKFSNETWNGFGNSHAKDVPSFWVIDSNQGEAWEIIKDKLISACDKRERLYRGEDKRLVYGQSDDLPGLIVDAYRTHILIQINTAGIDQYRLQVKDFFVAKYPQKKVVIFDNQSYRASESLPEFPREWDASDTAEMNDSSLIYRMKLERMQKIGFYLDHRDNRNKFERIIRAYYNDRTWSALDLFCYLGAWGLHALRAGANEVHFVDQADLENEVLRNTEQLQAREKSHFIRSDVFKYLDLAISEKKKWDVIVCDPPAFCKSQKQKNQAVSGYQKLYNRIFKLLATDGVLVAASCTKYISLEELTAIVEEQARQSHRKVWLRDIGIQGMDHPFSGFKDNANYIKYALYAVE